MNQAPAVCACTYCAWSPHSSLQMKIVGVLQCYANGSLDYMYAYLIMTCKCMQSILQQYHSVCTSRSACLQLPYLLYMAHRIQVPAVCVCTACRPCMESPLKLTDKDRRSSSLLRKWKSLTIYLFNHDL